MYTRFDIRIKYQTLNYMYVIQFEVLFYVRTIKMKVLYTYIHLTYFYHMYIPP